MVFNPKTQRLEEQNNTERNLTNAERKKLEELEILREKWKAYYKNEGHKPTKPDPGVNWLTDFYAKRTGGKSAKKHNKHKKNKKHNKTRRK